MNEATSERSWSMAEKLADLGRGSRPFPARYAGTCALTGSSFRADDTIRMHGFGPVSHDAIRAAGIPVFDSPAAAETAAARMRTYSVDVLLAWLNDGMVVNLFDGGRHVGRFVRSASGTGYCKGSAFDKAMTVKQLLSRTKAATFMVAEWRSR